ncbi:hypothetical protein [Micromonospora sp. NPDC051006]|uniref:hypothetical protein n=1 Tax=Micromonospora sp. NPDC051006 TaxID=3364283 RepID=UPI0037A034A2
MSDRIDWNDLRDRRMGEPGAAEAYEATWIAFELGQEARELRESEVGRPAHDERRHRLSP